jgi:hypothetical protein
MIHTHASRNPVDTLTIRLVVPADAPALKQQCWWQT